MTVAELIKALSAMKPDLEVLIETHRGCMTEAGTWIEDDDSTDDIETVLDLGTRVVLT